MAVSIHRTLGTAIEALANTERLLNDATTLPPHLQKIAGEILFLRTATTLENFLSDYYRKIVCGAAFVDGSSATTLIRARSISEAENYILCHGRRPGKRSRWVKWLLARDIRNNVSYVIDPNDFALTTLNRFTTQIDQIRIIRNHISHQNAGTKREYLSVVRTLYGPTTRSLPCGLMLMSRSIHSDTLLKNYIVSTRVIARTLCKG